MKRRLFSILLSVMISLQGIAPIMAEIEDLDEIVIEEQPVSEPISEETISEDEFILDESEELIVPDVIQNNEEEIAVQEESIFSAEEESFAEVDFFQEDYIDSPETESIALYEVDFNLPVEEINTEENTAGELPESDEDEIIDELNSGDVELVGEVIASGPCGENLTWTLDDKGVMKISGNGDMWNHYGFLTVGSFWNNIERKVTQIIVENGVTSIGDYAFKDFTNLTKITIPDSINSIIITAIDTCSRITSIEVSSGNSVYSSNNGVLFDKQFKELIFYPRGIQGAYTVPAKVTCIRDSAFSGCKNLTEITLPAGLKNIGNFAFRYCGQLSTITIPDGVTIIGKMSFAECITLSTIDFSGNAPTIGSDAFCEVEAVGYYPGDNSTWTNEIMQNYGGSITWKPNLTIQQPKLIGAYNGANGIGIKFIKEKNAKEYVIWRKENGNWSSIRTISANSLELQISGDRIMYTDTTVKKNYGKGYIYSVATKYDSLVTTYDTKGCAIYRLKPPTLTKAVNSAAGTATVYWSGVFGKTETNGNYDLQYAEYVNGKAGEFKSVTKLPGYNNTTLSAKVTGLKKGSAYVFRIRCSKTNKDRGTFYSEYSPWLSVKITK